MRTISTKKGPAQMQTRGDNFCPKLSLKVISYLLSQINEAAPKTAAFSLIPEANTLIFPL